MELKFIPLAPFTLENIVANRCRLQLTALVTVGKLPYETLAVVPLDGFPDEPTHSCEAAMFKITLPKISVELIAFGYTHRDPDLDMPDVDILEVCLHHEIGAPEAAHNIATAVQGLAHAADGIRADHNRKTIRMRHREPAMN